MVINGQSLLDLRPIRGMEEEKLRCGGASYGLAEVGYDIRLKQDIMFSSDGLPSMSHRIRDAGECMGWRPGRFILASAIEEFDMPNTLVGIVHDKSTWARYGLSVFNTVIEPGWRGRLTLELVYHGSTELHLPSGTGIAQVVFHQVTNPAQYQGKYQDQADRPVPAIHA